MIIILLSESKKRVLDTKWISRSEK